MLISAAVATAPKRPLSIETLEIDEPRPDEILVRIVAAGVCHTDISARDHALPIRLPAVLGHEGAGFVEAVGTDIRTVVPGDAVIVTFRSCGRCARCAASQPAYCQHSIKLNYTGSRPDGSRSLRWCDAPVAGNFFGQSSFATHALAYESNVVKVACDAPLERYAPLGCGIQTGAGAILRSLACPAGSSLLIFGAGSVGLSAVMAAVIAGCTTIVVVDPIAARRELARELGATHAFDPAGEPLQARIRAVLNAGADYAIDTTGRSDAMEAALRCLRSAGTLGLLGIPAADAPTPGLASAVLARGLKIQGIIEGDSDPGAFIPELIAYHEAGRFPFDRLIRHYPFDEINRAFAEQEAGLCIKPVLLMPEAGR